MTHPQRWQEAFRSSIKETYQDRLAVKLLAKSSLTKPQFETLLVDQLGNELANKRLTREEMTRLRASTAKISRGAFYRTLQQARANISKSIHTILLLGYSGLLESPSLAPYVEASDRLRSLTNELRQTSPVKAEALQGTLDNLIDDLERAQLALTGKERDV